MRDGPEEKKRADEEEDHEESRGFVSCQPTISSWLSPIRQGSKYENFKPSRESEFDFVATIELFVFLPKTLQSAGNFTHDITHIPQ